MIPTQKKTNKLIFIPAFNGIILSDVWDLAEIKPLYVI